MKRQRVRAVARWTCTLGCVLVGAVWVGSLWWMVNWRVGSDHRFKHVMVWNGGIEVIWHPGMIVMVTPLGPGPGPAPAPVVYRVPPELAEMKLWSPAFHGAGGSFDCRIPLYLPLALTLVPSTWLWRGEIRRRRLMAANACPSCGYDRRGIALDALCPECGKPAPLPGS